MGKIKFSIFGLLLAMSLVSCVNDTTTYPWNSSVDVTDSSSGDSETSSDNPTDSSSSDDSTSMPPISEYVYLTFSGASTVAVSDDNGFVSHDGYYLYITGAGSYELSGTASNIQVQVNADDTDVINLIFNGVSLSSAKNSPLYILNADKTNIYLADGTTSTLSDATSYTYENSVEEEPKATIHSKDDLNIRGNGSLIVYGNFNNGIHSSNDLRFKGTSSSYPRVSVTAVNNALKGKDSVEVDYANLNLTTSTGDAIQADTEDETDKGYVLIDDGVIDITSGRDGIQAYRYLQINGGTISIKTGRGSGYTVTDSESYKGLKSDLSIIINGGNISINAMDDALHSNGSMSISGGNITGASGDDGLHADVLLTISGGTINITKSYEGIESLTIDIVNGTIRLVSSDDAVNAVAITGNSTKPSINISGGYLYVNASGDGLDSNGSIYISGGTTIINGPTSDNNGPLDKGDVSGSVISISGGLLIAVGSKGMAEGPTTGSQYSALIGHTSSVGGSSLYVITDSSNTNILAFKPAKNSYSICVSSPNFVNGTYKLFSGGTYSNATSIVDGLYQGGTYTSGTQLATWTFSSSNSHYATGVGGGGGPH